MLQNRKLWTALSVVIGGLQAWDSGAVHAGGQAQLLIVLGLAAPALALVITDSWLAWLSTLVAGAVMLIWARLVSPVSLNALHIALMVPAMYIFFVSHLERKVAG